MIAKLTVAVALLVGLGLVCFALTSPLPPVPQTTTLPLPTTASATPRVRATPSPAPLFRPMPPDPTTRYFLEWQIRTLREYASDPIPTPRPYESGGMMENLR